jgi:DNA-binding response OmpR family regulator
VSEQPLTVLIAEDDPDQLKIRSLLLRHHGFSVIGCDTAASALKAAASGPIDCVLVDINFPLLADGMALIRELKAQHPDIRIVALTGASGEALRLHPEMMLIDDLFTKGAPAKSLVEAVKKLTADSRESALPLHDKSD